MFYSHEVLTSRKYGVATVWLVATLGNKNSLKKVSRKAILDVDVQRACETIVTPEAPMALRLQSNLLYGVTRVYSQQCGYVLHDAESAKSSMQTVFRAVRSSLIDEQAHIGRTDQLVLPDDPNFLPECDLMPEDFSSIAGPAAAVDHSARSTLSPYNSRCAEKQGSTQRDMIDLIVPPESASSFAGGWGSGLNGARSRGERSAGLGNASAGLLDDDLGLHIDDDGALRMDEETHLPAEPAGSGGRVVSSVMAMQARPEHQGVHRGADFPMQQDNDDYLPAYQDEELLPEGGAVQPVREEEEMEHVATEETAEAPLRRRVHRARKMIPMDTRMELRNGDLARWNQEYVANMTEALRQREPQRAAMQAKKNAEIWMLGDGHTGPLSMFTGAQLLETLTGIQLGTGAPKRPHEDDEHAELSRRTRSRNASRSHEEAREAPDDDGNMLEYDTIEQGREAPTPLADHRHSSLMPWNHSAGSRRPTANFSGTANQPTSASFEALGPQLSLLGSRAGRLTSASPLQGRGFPTSGADDFPPLQSQGDVPMGDADLAEEIELYGPAAQVDTQLAAQSQWQRATLDGESMHFLEFVQSGIAELDQYREEAEERAGSVGGSVDFARLLPPERHTAIVAAQAMLHVLSLGTRGLLSVEQNESFGAIIMRAVVAR